MPRSTRAVWERTTALEVVWLTCSIVALNVVAIRESLYRHPPDHTDEEENNCHNKENVEPAAERCGRDHSQQPERDQQNHEKHHHRRSLSPGGPERPPLRPSVLGVRLSESYADTTRLRRMPIPSTSVSMMSPTCSHSCGVRPMPTPSGVPVEIMSPGSSVQPRERISIV